MTKNNKITVMTTLVKKLNTKRAMKNNYNMILYNKLNMSLSM